IAANAVAIRVFRRDADAGDVDAVVRFDVSGPADFIRRGRALQVRCFLERLDARAEGSRRDAIDGVDRRAPAPLGGAIRRPLADPAARPMAGRHDAESAFVALPVDARGLDAPDGVAQEHEAER